MARFRRTAESSFLPCVLPHLPDINIYVRGVSVIVHLFKQIKRINTHVFNFIASYFLTERHFNFIASHFLTECHSKQ